MAYGQERQIARVNARTPKRRRFRNLVQPFAGNPDFFSSARSFAPPAGSNLGEADRLGGYYIDFGLKTDAARWPPGWLQPRDKQLHIATVQWGLGAYERYLNGEGEAWLDAALAAGDYLLSIQQRGGIRDGGWAHWMPMPHTYFLPPPWLSAITQGEAASFLVRLFSETGHERFADGARRALSPMGIPVGRGGLLAELEGLPFYEEYPSHPASYVLNGQIFALWGFRDVGIGLGDAAARAAFEQGVDALAKQIHLYDTGAWSRYELYPHPLTNVASAAYHLLHITQLGVLERIAPRPELSDALARFERYRTSWEKRSAAFARKVAFRLVVPRSKALAHRLPWNKRVRRRRGGEDGDVIALCYHAISAEWESVLSVTPARFEEQLRLLADRGYSGVTFSEAVLEENRSPQVAITFDDGYASTAEIALPILERMGMRATVFVPTDFMDAEGPMSWKGVEQWAVGQQSADLRPLSWEQIRRLADAGWEVGSHSTRHDRLPELGDAELAEALRRSREELEARLGRPCLSIAYPYGAYDERVLRAAAAAGFVTAATIPKRHSAHSDLSWPRTGVYRPDSMRVFRLKISRSSRRLHRTRAWEWLAAPARFLLRGARSGRADQAT